MTVLLVLAACSLVLATLTAGMHLGGMFGFNPALGHWTEQHPWLRPWPSSALLPRGF